MIRHPDRPFPESAATWNPQNRRLTVTAVREVDPGIRSVAIDISFGDINVRGKAPEDSLAAPITSELTAQLSITARNEEKARKILLSQAHKIKITTSPEGIAVTQETDSSFPTRRELFFSRWRFLLDRLKRREVDFALFLGKPKLDVSLRAPAQEILYELSTDYGDVTVDTINGDTGSSVNTSTGAVDVSHYQGALKVTSEYGDVRVTEHKGDLVVRTDTGMITISDVEGDTQVRTDYGDLTLDSIKGDVAGNTVTGKINVINVSGNAHLETEYDDIDARQITDGLNASTNTGDIVGNHIYGSSNVKSDYGNIDLTDTNGNLDISTVTGDIDVEGIDGSVRIETEYGSVKVANARLRGRDNRLATTTGNISASILNDDLMVNASTSTGDFKASGVQIDSVSGYNWNIANVGQRDNEISTNRLEVVTDYGDIFIAKAGE